MTAQEPESPIRVTSLDLMTTTKNQITLRHRVGKGNCLAKLIDKKCMVACYLNDVQIDMLLDSGAQVTTFEKSWLAKLLPDVQIRPLGDLLPDNPLRITAANGTDVPFEGWVEIQVEIKSERHSQVAIDVPMLLSKSCVSGPLLGSM